jgi:hypothetical protein
MEKEEEALASFTVLRRRRVEEDAISAEYALCSVPTARSNARSARGGYMGPQLDSTTRRFASAYHFFPGAAHLKILGVALSRDPPYAAGGILPLRPISPSIVVVLGCDDVGSRRGVPARQRVGLGSQHVPREDDHAHQLQEEHRHHEQAFEQHLHGEAKEAHRDESAMNGR